MGSPRFLHFPLTLLLCLLADPTRLHAQTAGLFLNPGGAPVVMEWGSLWIPDSAYMASGDLFQVPPNVTIGNQAAGNVYQSMRYFGAKAGTTNTYSLPVSGSSYYIIRLYFAEILYSTVGARVFSVLINSDAALLNYTLPSIQAPIIKEFYIPAPASTAISPNLNITFIRGPIGDPMVNAISITPADTLYPWLPLAVGNMTGNGSWERLTGLDCGASEDWGPDSSGRYWVSDLPYLLDPNNTVLFEYGMGDTAGQHQVNGTETSPDYLPLQVYQTAQSYANSDYHTNLSLNYEFPAVPLSLYRVRCHFTELVLESNRTRMLNVAINGVDVATMIDIHGVVGIDAALLQDYTAFTHVDTITVQISADTSSISSDPVISGLELFRYLPPVDAATVAAYSLLTPTYLPPLPSSSTVSSSSFWGGGGAIWKGIAVGASVMIVLMVLAVSCCLFPGWGIGWGGGRGGESALGRGDVGVGRQIIQRELRELLGCESSGSHMSRFSGPLGARAFTVTQLHAATNNFDAANVVGKGGFGNVYRAVLDNSLEVAVKRLAVQSTQGEKEFLREVEVLSRVHHRHLVNLIGFCGDRNNLCLVYEYLPLGTLRDALKDEAKAASLPLPARLRIALGAARGIEYLHTGAVPAVIHRDIKSSNIMLEASLDAKVADFGLSRLGKSSQEAEGTDITTAVRGTLGYLDPQYYKSRRLTDKSDVYSFGVVLLELLTGRLPIWMQAVTSASQVAPSDASSGEWAGRSEVNQEQVYLLVEWAVPRIKSKDLEEILAPQLQTLPSTQVAVLAEVADLAVRCVDMQPKSRPPMSEVVRTLEQAYLSVSKSTLPSWKAPSTTIPAPNHPNQPEDMDHPLLNVPDSAGRPVQLFAAASARKLLTKLTQNREEV